jgi:hypothetical protein
VKFEDAGRALDREVAKLVKYLDRELKPTTRQEMAALLRKAARRLAKAARDLEGKKR